MSEKPGEDSGAAFDEKAKEMLLWFAELRRLSEQVSDGAYWLEKLILSYKLLLGRYAPFKVGDCVQLAVTPNITVDTAPGWLGCQHFLIAVAPGVVESVDVGSRGLWYRVSFDNESWIDRDGIEHKVTIGRHVFSFGEDALSALPEIVESKDMKHMTEEELQDIRVRNPRNQDIAALLREVDYLRHALDDCRTGPNLEHEFSLDNTRLREEVKMLQAALQKIDDDNRWPRPLDYQGITPTSGTTRDR
jgi:hypothetical protein